MLLLVSGATATVRRWKSVGELIVPGAGNDPDSLKLTPGRWAMDNGAYSGFEVGPFMRMLQRFMGRKGCRWVACPDAVGDAFATLERWPFWSKVIRGVGFVPALVLQDGMLVPEVPWPEIGAVFVGQACYDFTAGVAAATGAVFGGGTDAWKFSPQARDLCAYAKARGLSVHVGRVNSRTRIEEAHRMGADSFDGGQYSMFPDRRIPEGVADAEAVGRQGVMTL